MNYTTNYHLPQWVETDRIMMEDFNQAMADIDESLSQTYTTERRPANLYQVVLNSSYSAGDTLYTFPEKPSFVLVMGYNGFVLLRDGEVGTTNEHYTYSVGYDLSLQLSGKKLILYGKGDKLTYTVLKCIVFR